MRDAPTLLGTYPHTQALKSGEVTGELVRMDFVERSPVNRGFYEMIQDQSFDVSELAIGAFFQAFASGSSIRLLPVVTFGGFHHSSIYYDAARGPLSAADLRGKRVAVRSYSQTTGLWVRSLLEEEYGVAPQDVTWVVTEASHLAGFADPANVERAPDGIDAESLLTSGAADAAILLGPRRDAGDVQALIPDAAAAAGRWQARHGFIPINHMVCVSGALASDPELVADVVASFARAADRAPERPDSVRQDLATMLTVLGFATDAALRQGLIGQAIDVPAMFAEGAGVDTPATRSA